MAAPDGALILKGTSTEEGRNGAHWIVVLQQGAGYSGYHGAEFVNIEGDHEHAARPPQQQGDVCMSDGEVKSGSAEKRALRGAPAQEPEAKRQHVMGASPDGYRACPGIQTCCTVYLDYYTLGYHSYTTGSTLLILSLPPRSVKQEEEQGTGSHSGASGRELRALTRSAQGLQRGESPQPEGCSGSAKGPCLRPRLDKIAAKDDYYLCRYVYQTCTRVSLPRCVARRERRSWQRELRRQR